MFNEKAKKWNEILKIIIKLIMTNNKVFITILVLTYDKIFLKFLPFFSFADF